MHDHRLSRFRLGPSLGHLVNLVLSFNELTAADDFKDMVSFSNTLVTLVTLLIEMAILVLQPSLEVLDLSFNKLSSLRGMKVSSPHPGLGQIFVNKISSEKVVHIHNVCL